MKLILLLKIFIFFTLLLLVNLTNISKRKIRSKNKSSCEVTAPKYDWNDSSEFCGSEKDRLNSMDQCEETEIIHPFLGYTWLYCYPKASDKDVYYRVELRACIGFNKYRRILQVGSRYNDLCSQPTRNNYLDKFSYKTDCTYKKKRYFSKYIPITNFSFINVFFYI